MKSGSYPSNRRNALLRAGRSFRSLPSLQVPELSKQRCEPTNRITEVSAFFCGAHPPS